MFSSKTLLKILFNTLLGIILILIWLRFVDIHQILQTISQANILLLLPPFVFLFLSIFTRSIRLKIFLAPVKSVKLKDLTFLNGVALMLNFLIPIRAGEFAKGFYFNTQYGLPLKKSILWIFLDRFIDFLVVLISAGLLLFFVPNKLGLSFAVTISVIGIAMGVMTYLIIYQTNFTLKILNFLKALLVVNMIKIYFERVYLFILETFAILKRRRGDIVKLLGLSILSYISDAATWYFTFLALNSPQGFINMFLGQLLSALTYLIPAAPGYVGSAEASGLLILSGVFGLDSNLSSAMIVLFHIMAAIFVIVFGLISLYNLKIDLKLILKKALGKD